MVQTGDVYLIPLVPGKHAVATVVTLGAPVWNPRWPVMLVSAHGGLVEGTPPTDPPGAPVQQYWCDTSFVEEGKWTLLRRGEAAPEPPGTVGPVWSTHELFLDDLRQRLGLERQTYTGAQFTFSAHCQECGAPLEPGLARCRRCGAIREEFRGLERFVVNQFGNCCLSGAPSDVRDANGNYYWAPYFIDLHRARDARASG